MDNAVHLIWEFNSTQNNSLVFNADREYRNIIVQTPRPLFKGEGEGAGVNFDYLPQRGGSMVQGASLLKRRRLGAGTFPI